MHYVYSQAVYDNGSCCLCSRIHGHIHINQTYLPPLLRPYDHFRAGCTWLSHIPVICERTCCICIHLLQLHVLVAYAYTCCNCIYLLHLHIPATSACTCCICKGSAAVGVECWVVALQPGVASVYCSIVQQTSKSVEFFFKHFSMLEGKTYSEARYDLLLLQW